jgi:hypothetical protein
MKTKQQSNDHISMFPLEKPIESLRSPPLRAWLGEVAIKILKNTTSNREPCTEILASSKFQLLSWSDMGAGEAMLIKTK